MSNSSSALPYDIEQQVIARYAAGAQQPEAALCCPSDRDDAGYLAQVPAEIVAKDYGCGDPTPYVTPGETVVDLGSGAGKNCYMLAQRVGPSGQVIGVDFNDAMLALSRRYLDDLATTLGYRNLRFVKGKIQDLALDLEQLEHWLQAHPVTSLAGMAAIEAEVDRLRSEMPLVASNSVDVVISNCVLNLVRPQDKQALFQEIHRVLKPGGRAVISDIVCDEEPTPAILKDPDLWSGCIAGAFLEPTFLAQFEQAGFYGVEILARQSAPWQVVDGIEFRSLTVRAFKGQAGPCLERHQAVIYRGPWKSVQDEEGHTLYRGQPMAVCDRTFQCYTDPAGPYHADLIAVPPLREVPLAEAQPFVCAGDTIRDPRQTKGQQYRATTPAADNGCCSPN